MSTSSDFQYKSYAVIPANIYLPTNKGGQYIA